jgi:hypothetical protein
MTDTTDKPGEPLADDFETTLSQLRAAAEQLAELGAVFQMLGLMIERNSQKELH